MPMMRRPGPPLPGSGRIVQLSTLSYSAAAGWSEDLPDIDSEQTLVVAFGAPEFGADARPFEDLRRAFPTSRIVGCSTAGEIIGTDLRDGSVVVAAARFDSSTLRAASASVGAAEGSFAAGQDIARQLADPGLRGVLVLSDGLTVNGSELVRGLTSVLPPSVVITGGLAADGDRFGAHLGARRRDAGPRHRARGRLLRRRPAPRPRLDGRLGHLRPRAHHHALTRQRALRARRAPRPRPLPDLPRRALERPAGHRPALPAGDPRGRRRRPQPGADDPRDRRGGAVDDLRRRHARGMAGPAHARQRRPPDRGRGRRRLAHPRVRRRPGPHPRARHQLRRPPSGARRAHPGGDRGGPRVPARRGAADRLLLLRGDLAPHLRGLRAAQPDDDPHDHPRGRDRG